MESDPQLVMTYHNNIATQAVLGWQCGHTQHTCSHYKSVIVSFVVEGQLHVQGICVRGDEHALTMLVERECCTVMWRTLSRMLAAHTAHAGVIGVTVTAFSTIMAVTKLSSPKCGLLQGERLQILNTH